MLLYAAKIYGKMGFEPMTFCSQNRHATWLRHSPKLHFGSISILITGIEPVLQTKKTDFKSAVSTNSTK